MKKNEDSRESKELLFSNLNMIDQVNELQFVQQSFNENQFKEKMYTNFDSPVNQLEF